MHQDTFSYAIDEKTPAQAGMLDLVNAHFELTERRKTLPEGSDEREALERDLSASREKLEAALLAFSQDSGGHSNHPWIVLTMSSIVASTLGNLESAIAFEFDALEKAVTNSQRAKNANNLCEYFRESGRLDEALQWGYAAVVWSEGTNAGAVLNYSSALHASGQEEAAKLLIEEVRKRSKVGFKGDVLTAYVKFEPNFGKMRALPVVKELFESVR